PRPAGAAGALPAGLCGDGLGCAPRVPGVGALQSPAGGPGAHPWSRPAAMLLLSGALVSGPYALITTAVSTDLGTHRSLKGNARALATVTAIIDGTGSVGAALGPLLAGLISPSGWNNVFYMLMLADACALL
ncbi:Glucose-6-phosphate exchanger SLC37A1, partial [Galemys pyrenaicus]